MSSHENKQAASILASIKALQEIGITKAPDKWLLIDPFGNSYEGDVAQIMMILAKEHPFLKINNKAT